MVIIPVLFINQPFLRQRALDGKKMSNKQKIFKTTFGDCPIKLRR
jgi:hypothetical protein